MNRRQADVDERAALADWRADERKQALLVWSDTGRLGSWRPCSASSPST
jgi:hypothetical protein